MSRLKRWRLWWTWIATGDREHLEAWSRLKKGVVPGINAQRDIQYKAACDCKPFRLEGEIPGDFTCVHCGAVWGSAGGTLFSAEQRGR